MVHIVVLYVFIMVHIVVLYVFIRVHIVVLYICVHNGTYCSIVYMCS